MRAASVSRSGVSRAGLKQAFPGDVPLPYGTMSVTGEEGDLMRRPFSTLGPFLGLIAALILVSGCAAERGARAGSADQGSADQGSADQGSAVGSPGAAARPGGTVTQAGARGRMVAAGNNAFGQLGTQAGPGSDRMRLVRGPQGGSLDGVVTTAAGGRHSIAVLSGGRVFAWGANDKGQLGDGTTKDSDVPVAVRAPDGAAQLRGAVAVSADTDFSMALMGDGTVVTWGRSDAGQRGIGRSPAPLTPTTVLQPDGKGPLTGVAGVAADGRTAFALLKKGRLLGWGSNDYGQVGDGTTQERDLPVPVRGLDGSPQLADVVQVAAGGQHGLALLADGRVAAWGSNERGQLGHQSPGNRYVPGLVTALDGRGFLDDVIQVSAAERHNFALRKDGTVVGWGTNRAGQMSDGTREMRAAPGPVLRPDGQPLDNVSRVFAGEAYGVAILRDGSALTWGANSQGQLGQSAAGPSRRPRPVVMDGVAGRVVAAAPGERHLLLVVQQ